MDPDNRTLLGRLRGSIMGNRAYEKVIFQALLDHAPLFLGEDVAEWSQPADEGEFPDVICQSASGRRFGVEMGEWLHEAQTATAKQREKLQASFLEGVEPQGLNETKHISSVWLGRRPGVYLGKAERPTFRSELFECLNSFDADDTLWDSPQGYHVTGNDLLKYPTLAKYLQDLTLHPAGSSRYAAERISVDSIPRQRRLLYV